MKTSLSIFLLFLKAIFRIYSGWLNRALTRLHGSLNFLIPVRPVTWGKSLYNDLYPFVHFTQIKISESGLAFDFQKALSCDSNAREVTFPLQEWGLRLKCVSTPLEGGLCLNQGADKVRVRSAATSRLDPAAADWRCGPGQGTSSGPHSPEHLPVAK